MLDLNAVARRRLAVAAELPQMVCIARGRSEVLGQTATRLVEGGVAVAVGDGERGWRLARVLLRELLLYSE